MNFTYSVTQPNDMAYGALKKDGSWTGRVCNDYSRLSNNCSVTIVHFEKFFTWEIFESS